MDILLLEDEKLAAENLQNMLNKYFGNDPKIAWVRSIREGEEWLENNPMPDLILSDIELLDGNVFSLFEMKEISCPIIFATAYDRYLLQAFTTNGIAYLLKPFQYKELVSALDKYKTMFGQKSEILIDKNMMKDLKLALQSSQKEYKTRFAIKKSSGIFLLNNEDIICFTADDDIVFAFDREGQRHIVQYRMSELEEVLNPDLFFRINRSAIVHIKYIKKIERFFNNRLAIHLHKFSEQLKTSGPKTAAFRKWIE